MPKRRASRVIRVGDRVRSNSFPGVWTVDKMVRADAFYHRRAWIVSPDGERRIIAAHVLRRES